MMLTLYFIPVAVALGWVAGFLVFNKTDFTGWVKQTVYDSALWYTNHWAKELEKSNRFIDELLVENTRLGNAVMYGQPQPVLRAIDTATSLRLMKLDPAKSHRDDYRYGYIN